MLFGVRRVREDWGHVDMRGESWEGAKRKELFSEKTTCVKCVKTFAFVLRCVEKQHSSLQMGLLLKKFQSFDLKVEL